MTIRPEEALGALRDIDRAEHNSAAAYRYQKASPHLLLWGAIWVAGYGATYVHPSVWIWPVLVVAGCAGSAWIALRPSCGRATSWRWRYAATFVTMYLFFWGFFVIYPPKSGLQASALFPLLVALWYVLLGVWTSAYRIAVLGVVVGMLNIGGFLWLPQFYLLWMAVLGGGALILGGVWLRKA